MPQIPDFIATVRPDAGGLTPRRDIADRSIDFSGVLRPLQEFTDKYLLAKRLSDTADYQNANTKALADLEYKWSKVPDRQKAVAGFDADVAALKKQNVDTIEDPLMRASVGMHFNDQAVSRSLQTGDNAFRLESSAHASKLDQAQLDNADLASKAGNATLRMQIQDQMNQQIDNDARGGWITPEDAVRRKAQFNNSVASLSAQQDIDRDPYGTKTRLQGEGYKGLLPQERENLIHNADDEIKRRQAEAERKAAEAQRLFVAQQSDLYEEDVAGARDGKSLNLTSLDSLTKAYGDKGVILWQNLQDTKKTAIGIEGMALKNPADRQAQVDAAKPPTSVLPSADIESLNLNPQEEHLYQHHVHNVTTPGQAVRNEDGSYSTVSQTSQEHNGRFYNIPTVWDGQHHTEDQAYDRVDSQNSWDQWPSYPTREEAEARYQKMHAYMEKDQPGALAGNVRYKEEQENHLRLAEANDRITKAWQDDSAAAALSFSPAVQQKWQEAAADPTKTTEAIGLSVQTQRGAGVPEGQERILTKDQAADAVRRINAARGDDATNIMQTEAKTFGIYWNKAFGELVAAGLNPAYQVLGTTPPGAAADSARLTLSRQLEAGPDAVKAVPNQMRQSVDSAVDDALSGFTATVQYTPDGARLRDQYGSAIRLVAYSYAQMGMQPAQAAQRAAAELLLNKYDLVQEAHFNARAPAGQGPLVQGAALFIESHITPNDLPDPDAGALPFYQHPELTPEQRKQDYWFRTIQSGTWVTNKADDGWLLLDASGLPVRLANGKPVAFKYDEAERLGSQLDVARRQQQQGQLTTPSPVTGGLPQLPQGLP